MWSVTITDSQWRLLLRAHPCYCLARCPAAAAAATTTTAAAAAAAAVFPLAHPPVRQPCIGVDLPAAARASPTHPCFFTSDSRSSSGAATWLGRR